MTIIAWLAGWKEEKVLWVVARIPSRQVCSRVRGGIGLGGANGRHEGGETDRQIEREREELWGRYSSSSREKMGASLMGKIPPLSACERPNRDKSLWTGCPGWTSEA